MHWLVEKEKAAGGIDPMNTPGGSPDFLRGILMHRRIHSGSNDLGKWKSRVRTGVGAVTAEEYRDWTIELTHRTVGTTIKCDQFVVTLRRDSPAYDEQLAGFSSKVSAMAAARKRIELLSAERRPLGMTRNVRRARNSPNDA